MKPEQTTHLFITEIKKSIRDKIKKTGKQNHRSMSSQAATDLEEKYKDVK